jgi:uncharacterized protein (UPF0305 family)
MVAVKEDTRLKGNNRIYYLLRQLDLTAEQRRFARDLFANILDDEVNPPLSLAQVRSIVAEIEEAKKQGDKEREEELAQQLRDLARNYDREDEFLMNMETVLTEEQKVTLQRTRERLKRNPSGSLRPIEVFRAVGRLDLTKDQQARFKELHKTFREKLREIKELNDEMRFQLMNGLLELVRAELTPAQYKEFEFSIRRLRPDLAFRLRIFMPDTQPAPDDEELEDAPED